MVTTNIGSSTSVDMTAVGRSDLRDRLRDALEQMEGAGALRESRDFWTSFFEAAPQGKREPTLVFGDLAPVMQKFREHKAHRWTTSVRTRHCYFVTFVRTERDRRYAAWVDDLVKASDSRVNVCNDVSDWGVVTQCLRSAVSALKPDALLEVRFLSERDQFWLHFGDDRIGMLTLDEIGLRAREEDLVFESATVGDMGTAVEVATRSGDLFEIDAAALRSLVDRELHMTIRERADSTASSLGATLRARRQRAGLTQVELSRASGLDQAVISRIERGKVRPRIDTLRHFAEGLELSVGELLSSGTS